MFSQEACCTCAQLLTDTKVPYDTESEKPLCLDRSLDCCGRTICATCQYNNPRFQTYCPFCQISSEPTSLPATGLRMPPSYSDADSRRHGAAIQDLPPAYDSLSAYRVAGVGITPPTDTQDVVHFLSAEDTMSALSLAYSVPQTVLRQHNSLYQDALLAGRKFVLIPHTHYQGPALSTPPDPEEEERKNKIRRWMVATKCAEYNVAVLYLKASDYNLNAAVQNFKADEQWEKEHPLNKGKGVAGGTGRRFGGSSLSSQLS